MHIQATTLEGVEEVNFTLPLFKEVTDTIEGIAGIEFGLEVAHELGQLTVLQMKGSGISNLRH